MEWPFNPALTIALVAGLSGPAAVAAFWLHIRQFKRDLASQHLQFVGAKLKYLDDIRGWAGDISDAITEAIHLCDLNPVLLTGESFFDRRHRLRIALSTLIDQGRWYFPNMIVDDHGADKELGFRGYRHEVLDGPVRAYNLIKLLDYKKKENNASLRNELTDSKRHFVGQVQSILKFVSHHSVMGDFEKASGGPAESQLSILKRRRLFVRRQMSAPAQDIASS